MLACSQRKASVFDECTEARLYLFLESGATYFIRHVRKVKTSDIDQAELLVKCL